VKGSADPEWTWGERSDHIRVSCLQGEGIFTGAQTKYYFSLKLMLEKNNYLGGFEVAQVLPVMYFII